MAMKVIILLKMEVSVLDKQIPQYKFFDEDNKVFVSGYLIDEYGQVVSLYLDKKIAHKNIIAVPFTGFYDKNENPIYESDIVKSCLGIKEFGKVFKDRDGAWYINLEKLPSLCYYVDSEINDWMEIIGSALTNSELLNGEQ